MKDTNPNKKQKVMPEKPKGEFTLPSGEKVKLGPNAVAHTKAKYSPLALLKKLKEAAKEGIFPPPVSPVNPV